MASQGKAISVTKIAKKPYLPRRIDGQSAPESSIRALCLAFRQTGGFKRRVPLMAMVPGKAPTPPTVTLKHLAAALAETHRSEERRVGKECSRWWAAQR